MLIVIIVIIVRRRDVQDRTSPKDRTVVAFENPMYDTASKRQTEVTIHETATEEQHEGLYDEPAFKAKIDRENPLFHSTEDLTGEGTDGANNNAGYAMMSHEEETPLTDGLVLVHPNHEYEYEDEPLSSQEESGYLDVCNISL